jgi:hypothetical protein
VLFQISVLSRDLADAYLAVTEPALAGQRHVLIDPVGDPADGHAANGDLRDQERSSLDFDEGELLKGVKAQHCLEELALAGADAVGADLHVIEPGLARLPPGEHVKEATELAAVRCYEAFEDPHQPDGRSGLSNRPDRASREPLRPQLTAE